MIIPESNSGTENRLLPYLLICLVVLITYLPSFTGEFILDDIPLVKNNQYFKEWHSIGSYLAQEDGYNKDAGAHTGYYRPVINLFYALDYKIWGMSAPGFRITNLVLHLLTCYSLFALYTLILKNRNIALMLVLLFSIHPVNTETVSWITSRNNILVTLFGILSLIFYMRSYKKRKYYEYILSVIFFSLAVFSKEFGLMLLPIFFLYQRILNNKKEDIFVELREYLPFVIIAAVYFIFRLNVTSSLITPVESSNLFTRIYHAPYLIFLNLKLVFLPFQLHSFIQKYPVEIFNVLSFICILLFLVGAVLLYVFRGKSILVFSILSFFITIFPVLNIIKTSATSLIGMRWLYFPLVFILLLLYLPLNKLNKYSSVLPASIVTCLIVFLSANTFILNRHLWHSPKVFFEQEVLHFKNYFYADGLATKYIKEKPELAMVLFEKNFKSGILQDVNYYKYALLLIDKNEPEKALEYIDKARRYCYSQESLALIYSAEGAAFLKLNKLEEAKKYFKKTIKMLPEEGAYWESLGVVQGSMGDHMAALDSFKKAIKLGLGSSSVQINLGNAYIETNECDKALSIVKRFKKDNKDATMNRLAKKVDDCFNKKNE